MEDVQLILTDRISNLPDDVMVTILGYLPIRDAVRSSILSKKWTHVWKKLPQLVLDETLWQKVANETKSAKCTLKKVLYHLLLCHDGLIQKFTLSYPQLQSCTEIDHLIFFLAKGHLEDFTLDMLEDTYSLPYSIFSCQKLRHLSLRFCCIKSFPSVGFSNLTTLKLREISISAETLARLISGSPLLSTLVVESYLSCIDISIDAPNLRVFDFHGQIKSINFKRVPRLDWLSILLSSQDADDIVDFIGVGRNIAKFFDSMLSLETIQLSFHVVQSFGNEVPKRLSISLIYLKNLKLYSIGFNEKVDLLFTLCLLRSSPMLEFIEIEFQDFPDSNSEESTSYMEAEDYSDICLSELREVNLELVKGTRPELEFIRLLFAKSLKLKKFRILVERSVVDSGFKILKEVMKFQKISKETTITLDA